MKYIIFACFAIILGLTTMHSPLFAGSCCGGSDSDCQSQGASTIKADNLAVKTAVYVCPMHPEVQSDKPGKCPKCGMDLVKNEAPDTVSGSRCGDTSNCNMGPTDDKVGTTNETSVNTVVSKTENNSALQTYQCPMHPEVTSDKPGKCPKCGMNLEKK